MRRRESGILLPVSSLPGKYGIGGFSKEAYEWIDDLCEAGQRYWQILPLGPTGYGDSPYQSFSTFAGNPYLISPEVLEEDGLLTREECEAADCGQNPSYVDYERLYETRGGLLEKAYARFRMDEADPCFRSDEAYAAFLKSEQAWLEDYTLFLCLKEENAGLPWLAWPKAQRDRAAEEMRSKKEIYRERMAYHTFVQYIFMRQWKALKAYANEKGIRIIGDIPIYVAMDSSDAWAHPELFQFDENKQPKGVAGCPPDGFAPTGQLWGNPLYDWGIHEQTGFAWWIERTRRSLTLYDVIRIDHFRGFESYYSIPYMDPTAERGHWEEGPGMKLFDALRDAFGKMDLIAEDLGFLTDSVRALVNKSGFPGMKVLQFAFDSGAESEYLPQNFTPESIVYTGTHDNETTKAYLERTPDQEGFRREYLNLRERAVCVEDLIRCAMQSVSRICIIPMQDYLELGNEARMNHPSTLGGNNWKWRMTAGAFDAGCKERVRYLTWLSGRLS